VLTWLAENLCVCRWRTDPTAVDVLRAGLGEDLVERCLAGNDLLPLGFGVRDASIDSQMCALDQTSRASQLVCSTDHS
jgi:hypothetical protein